MNSLKKENHYITNGSNASWFVDLFILALLFTVFYSIWLGAHPLFVPDEGRYSEVAREMIATGDYITPRINGVAFLDKPILYYWLQASAIHWFGLNEWALRFWPACLGVFGCLMTYVAGRKLFERRTGLLSACLLATCPLYYGAAHYANLDLEVAVWISSSLFCLIMALRFPEKTSRRFFIFMLAYIFSALAVLTKGLIGIVFPILILSAWIFSTHQKNIFKKIYLMTGIAILFVIILPWYVLVQKANPEFLHFFFVTQQISRFLSTEHFNNKTPIWFYIPILLIGFFPWVLLLFQTIFHQIKQIQQTAILFLLLWALIIFIFFSIPHSKTIGYILPILPALALLTGNYLNQFWNQPAKKILLLFSFFSIGIVVIALAAPHVTSWNINLKLIPYLYCIAIIFFISGSVAFLLRKKNFQALFYCFLISSSASLLTVNATTTILNQKSIKPLAMKIKKQLHPHDVIVTFYRYYQDLPLYLERRITILADWNSPDIEKRDNWVRELWYGKRFQDTHAWLIDEKTFWQTWHSQKTVFVFLDQDDYAQLVKKSKKSVRVMGKQGDVMLIENQP